MKEAAVATALMRKSRTDLSRRRARTVLTVLTLALAVASFGILAIPSLMNQAMNAEVTQARLDDLKIPVNDVTLSAAQLGALARLPDVTAVTARSMFATRAFIGGQRVATEIWGVPSFTAQPVDQVLTASRPGPGQVLADVQDSGRGLYHGTTGDTVALQAGDGSIRTVTVAGSARSMALSQDTQTGDLVLYATQATVQDLGGFHGVNVLEFRLRDTSAPAARATVAAVRSFLAAQPNRTAFAGLPAIRAPGDWPGKSTFDAEAKVLVILIVLAVLCAAFLLATTIRTMIAEQTAEIGVMRAIGASRRDVRRAYLRTAALLGLLGAAVGMILGIGLANLLTGLFARVFFGVSPGLSVDWPVAAASAVAGLAGTVVTAWPMLRRPLRMPVREALSPEGLASGFGGSGLDHILLHSGALPAPERAGVRNVARQKGRTITTVVQVALAVATTLGLISLAQAVSATVDRSWNVLAYDITLAAQPGGHGYGPAIVNTVRAQPGVAGVQAIDTAEMTYQGQTLYAWGLPAPSYVYDAPTAGRWLTAQDERTGAPVIVAGAAAARLWHLSPGSTVTLTTAGGPVKVTVIGVAGSNANNGYNIYTTLPALQAATGRPGAANTLIIRAANTSHPAIDALAARLEDSLARAGYPSASQLMYAGRASNKAQNQTMVVIVQGIGLLIVAISMLGLLSTVTMSIIERTREIGVLRAIGARARDVRRIFRAETITLAVIGFVLAIPLGWLIAHALQSLVLHLANISLSAPYSLPVLGAAFIGTVVLAVLVVASPLRRATRLRPGDAIRYG
jgi:putative ABC transport system permease protein